MKKSSSLQKIQDAANSAITQIQKSASNVNLKSASETILGPSQLHRVTPQKKDPKRRPWQTVATIISITCTIAWMLLWYIDADRDLKMVADVVTMRRLPIAAQDSAASAVWICASLPVIWVVDRLVCAKLLKSGGAQWFLLHSIGNMFVVLGSLADFYFTFKNPFKVLSLQYCKTLPSYACNDWPTCIIIALHLYHCMGFKLSSEDIFHHFLFVPVIGFARFFFPWGTAGNILCFFISGLPGGIDYFLLALVKDGRITSMVEKRANLSINVWLRMPGITAFCILTLSAWLKPPPGTPPSDLMPVWGFLPMIALVFYNGQYYGMRVIGNYYIRLTQEMAKKGDDGRRVELHAS